MVQRYGDISRLQSPQCGQTPGPQPLIISTLANSHTDNAQKLTPILMYGPRFFTQIFAGRQSVHQIHFSCTNCRISPASYTREAFPVRNVVIVLPAGSAVVSQCDTSGKRNPVCTPEAILLYGLAIFSRFVHQRGFSCTKWPGGCCPPETFRFATCLRLSQDFSTPVSFADSPFQGHTAFTMLRPVAPLLRFSLKTSLTLHHVG